MYSLSGTVVDVISYGLLPFCSIIRSFKLIYFCFHALEFFFDKIFYVLLYLPGFRVCGLDVHKFSGSDVYKLTHSECKSSREAILKGNG